MVPFFLTTSDRVGRTLLPAMKRTGLWIVLTLSGCVAWAPAQGAKVAGYGQIETNLDDPEFESIYTQYEFPVFFDVRKIVRLTPSQVGGSGYKYFDYIGQAQFGRLRARSFLDGPVPLMPELSSGVTINVEFQDLITPQNLPITASYLRLDVELSGVMIKFNTPDSNGTVAHLQIIMVDPNSASSKFLSFVQFSRSGDNFSITNESNHGLDTPRFVPYPGEEPHFTQAADGYSFATRGYLDVPLDEDEGFPGLLFGAPFRLRVIAAAISSCGTEPCLASSDFHDVLISNARFVDSNGDPVAGASLTSESGYDYITTPVPEPELFAMQLVAVGLLGFAARRRPLNASA